LAFLIVAVFYLIVAAVLVLVGRSRLEKIKGPERAKRAATRIGQALRRESET
jgi:Putative Actinobacterial Holin-X, holin superfamily III